MPRYMHNNNKQLMINVLNRNSQSIPDLAKNLLHCWDNSRDELRPENDVSHT